jgi:hypothetical protein
MRELALPGRMRTHAAHPAFASTILLAVLTLAWWVYSPGLTGGFVFDDFGNLPSLGDYGRVDNWEAFAYYITSGTADPVGRPLALLSFLIDGNDWPADPYPFKRTNILLHLLNGALLCWLLLQLGRFAETPRPRVELAAVFGAGLWLLHPLWTSTTLYIVQREAMLPALFVLLGLLAYLHGRRRIAAHPVAGTLWIAGAVGLCTLMGVLSKANGILLPLFVMVVEWIFIRSQPGFASPPRSLSRCLAVTIYPVAFATLGYVAYQGFHGMFSGISSFRPWTLGQRLLTEPRVLLDYLELLIAPRPYSRGLFNDSYYASTSLIHPWTTLPSLLAVIALPAVAIRYRKHYPALALAVAFYFAGHVLESTTIPLELYFEHRNYLPAMLLLWPFALWLTRDGAWGWMRPLLGLGVVVLLSAETHFSAKLWGEPDVQALVWATQNPESPRAQSQAANAERSVGHNAQAEARLRRAIMTHPNEPQLAINLLGVRCQLGSIADSDTAAALHVLREGNTSGLLLFDWLSKAIGLARDQSCSGLTTSTVAELIGAAKQNSIAMESAKYRRALLNLEGQLALADSDQAGAEAKFLEALAADCSPDTALNQAAILGAANMPEAGLRQLEYYEANVARGGAQAIVTMQGLHHWILQGTGYWQHEIFHMRQILNEDVEANSSRRQDQS